MRALRLSLVAAMLSSMGAQWMLLQGAAWTRMTLERVGERGFAAALASAADGSSECSLCLTARRGAAESEKRGHGGAAVSRLDFIAPAPVAVSPSRVSSSLVAAAPGRALRRPRAVEPPPPDLLPA